ncbi:EamA family transporter [Burkholderiaceae bacterium FT117]|uniref:EamA family transporter n=1 Tax=Zeimonas sediminis TaxID=2944268 RepID=UPI002342DA9F|nr:EamA family transporter [Zeimonas sediminis]MCM5572105.1 EamA family transporter [Zeimonas sediminis]
MPALDPPAWLWIACTVAACGVQTVRNAMQRSLTERVGTVGATHVRFLFGLPFGLAFLAAMATAVDLSALKLSEAFLAWALMGGVFQILGTGLMLAAMRERSFVVSIAYVKTEPVQIAVFGLLFLGERLSLSASIAVIVATAGVLLMSMPAKAAAAGGQGGGAASGGASPSGGSPGTQSLLARWLPRAARLGIASGAMFALSAVGFRGAILELGDAPFYARATTTLATSLLMQTALLSGWLLWRDRRVLAEIFRLWRPSMLAGFAGALASQMWFLAFSLQTAAAVRTVGLVEILFAQAVSHKLFAQGTSRREAIGMAIMVGGVAWLMLSAS